jgi:hypothetical protein
MQGVVGGSPVRTDAALVIAKELISLDPINEKFPQARG